MNHISDDFKFLYDAAGYIAEEIVSGTLLNYDSLGRLTQVSNASGAVIGQYTYDGMNRRLTKTTGGVTTVFIYDIYNNLIGEYDSSTGNSTMEYVYLGSKPLAMITESTSSSTTSSSSRGCGIIDTVRSTINTGCSTTGISLRNTGTMTGMGAIDGFIYLFPLIGIAIIRLSRNAKRRKLDIIGLLTIGGMIILIVMVSRQTHAQVSGETIYYYHLDHLGTPIEMTDQNQNVVWQASYDPFGQATISTATVTNNLRFPGMYADSETGLYYNMNRYYYPAIGRYIEPDPILQPMMYALYNTLTLNSGDTLNSQYIFQYVKNNPINRIDRYGLYIGQMPPPPPGYDAGTWTSGVFADGTEYLQSPDGTKWIPHGEDSGHWRHWDRQNPGGDEGSWPSNSRKPWPGQGKCKPKQSTSDPNGNAPEMPWPPVMPFMPIEPIPWPGFAPEPIPIFEW